MSAAFIEGRPAESSLDYLRVSLATWKELDRRLEESSIEHARLPDGGLDMGGVIILPEDAEGGRE